MPQPRRHGGAELLPIPLVVPGFKGLNKQQASSTLGPEWATELINAVIDDSGRVAARLGWGSVTTAALGANIIQAYEFVKSDGTLEIVASTATTLHKSTDGGATFSTITGTNVFTSGNWQFMNFNDYVYGVQAGEVPIYYTGSGNFTAVADVNCPTGGIGLSAFGRLWITETDGHSIAYSSLLDGTDWTTADSGVLNLWNVWPDNDQITALAAFNGRLLVFGKNTIVVYGDDTGSTLGIDPVNLYVIDVVRGTGCIARDSLQEVDGDLWFLSDNGLQSLGRIIQEKSNPLDNLSRNVQDYLRSYSDNSDLALLRSVYSPKDKFYLLSFPAGSSTESGACMVFDTRGKLEDGSARCLGVWTLVPRALFRRRSGTIVAAILGPTGELGTYTGGLDDASTYAFGYLSGWLDLTQQGLLLIPKRYEGVFFSDSTVSVSFGWAFDFATEDNILSRNFTGGGSGGEWGIGEWGEAEFGGGVSLRRGQVPATGTGQYIRLSISCIINSTSFAIQKLTLFSKIGRLA